MYKPILVECNNIITFTHKHKSKQRKQTNKIIIKQKIKIKKKDKTQQNQTKNNNENIIDSDDDKDPNDKNNLYCERCNSYGHLIQDCNQVINDLSNRVNNKEEIA